MHDSSSPQLLSASSSTARQSDGEERWCLQRGKRRRSGPALHPAALGLQLPSLLSRDSRLLQVLVLLITSGLSCLLLQLLLNARGPSVEEQRACSPSAGRSIPSASCSASSLYPHARVLLVMTDNRELEQDADSPLALAVYANWLYTRLRPHYDFLYAQQSFSSSGDPVAATAGAAMPLTKKQPACYDGVLQHQRAASWCKLQVLYRLMAADAGRHDVIFFLDSDAVVSNYDIQLESLLALVRIQGCNGTEFQAAGSPCSALFFTNDWTRSLGAAQIFHFPNAGVWLVRPNAVGLELVQRWWHQSLPDYNLHHPYEQIGLWQLLDSMTPEQRAACTGVIIEPSMRDMSALQFVQHRSSWFANTRLPSFRQLQQRIVSDPQFAAAGIDTDFSATIAAIRQQAMSVMDLTRDEVPAVSDELPLFDSCRLSGGSSDSRGQLTPPPWTSRLEQIRNAQMVLEPDERPQLVKPKKRLKSTAS